MTSDASKFIFYRSFNLAENQNLYLYLNNYNV